MGPPVMQSINYWLSEHPTIIRFRWSDTQLWGSTWSFFLISISAYIAAAVSLHHLLLPLLLHHRRPVPLGPIPAVHSLAMTLISAATFVGILSSAAAEIRDTRWLWRRSKTTPFQWLLCFPLGTRSSGRVFFWSYVFYLSRYLHTLRTFFIILRRRALPHFQVLYDSILICMSFLWLEFSQSCQVLPILCMSLMYSMDFGYGFWAEIGFSGSRFPGIVINCHILLQGCNLICHVGVVLLHFLKGGCNGFGAGVVNFVLNVVIFFMFFKFYVKLHLCIRKLKVVTSLIKAESKSSSETNDRFVNGKEKDS